MDSRDITQPQHQQFQPPLFHYPNFNTGAMMGPNSTSQSINHRLTFGSLTPRGTLQQQEQQMDQKTLESLGYVDEVSPSSQPMRSGIGQNQQQVKRKRGRPRKYAPDGTIALGLAPTSPLGGDGDSGRVNTNSAKRARGRPPGSIKKQFDALGTSGGMFTPHVIEVKEGEEILSKVAALSNQGPRTVSVLSAAGAVSRVILHNPGGIHNYKGRFEIVTLSGSFSNYEVNGSIERTGSLTVALAGPNAQILGGLVGRLVAVTPVQIIVGSFVDEAKKLKQSTGNNAQGQNPEPASAPANMLNFGSNSQGPSSESSDENESGSPSVQHHDNNNNGIYGNSMAQQQQLRQMQMYNLWPSSGQ
ncbi:PREDICTED: AT-hook motif nuclear-localized protein 8 [Brassica oleracea var. oleracea]|uniref:AT-hook motif nuclear-localized protein n=1 Tax=Brassica oleracea var. oleracea TaxID=109376 RepID=A0A0D3E6X4_BRAOL|nr:PREDICTED: AT-hook motif nuclear-localized protein 8 [Brassica oleracea var. oleracea]